MADLLSTSTSEIAALVIGREIKKIAAENEKLRERLTAILSRQVELGEKSPFIRNMVQEADADVEAVVYLLKKLKQGLEG